MKQFLPVLLGLFLMTASLAACAGVTKETPMLTATVTPPRHLTPYFTPTASSTPAPPDAATGTPLPSPSPTLHTHTVRLGETMGSIAVLYGVTVPALMAANPEVDPNIMTVGMVLIIPAAPEGGNGGVPSPTAVNVTLSPVDCYPTAEGGTWCFLLAHNDQPMAVESLAVMVRAAGSDGQVISQTAYAMLNLLPAGQDMPLAVYFAPPVAGQLTASAEMQSALPLADTNQRYVTATLEDMTITIDPGGLSARVDGVVLAAEGQANAAHTWVLAAALDANGKLVGLRRGEYGGTLPPGGQPFTLNLYSAAGKIASVQTLVEVQR
jgi:LysM repeat protein